MYQYKNFLLRHVRIPWRWQEPAIAKDLRLLGAATRYMSTTDTVDSPALMNRVLDLVKKYDRIDAAKVTENADFQKDLGLDSLDRVELVMALEQEFSVEIPDEKADKLACCSDVVEFLVKEVGEGTAKSPSA